MRKVKKKPRRQEGDPQSKRRAPDYVLRLYITGATANSQRAMTNVKRICEKHLHGHYQLEVIDVCQQPRLAAGDQIIAAPTLLKQLPLPLRRLIGDMSNTERTLLGLDIRPHTGIG